jgi:hypothetical protein
MDPLKKYILGREDSNLRMQAPKACVLPLDDTPNKMSLLFFRLMYYFSVGFQHNLFYAMSCSAIHRVYSVPV